MPVKRASSSIAGGVGRTAWPVPAWAGAAAAVVVEPAVAAR